MAARRRPRLPDTGSRAPEVSFTRIEGGEVTLGEIIADGPVVLAFFKVTCPVCQLTLPFLERIHAAGTLPVYGISQNDASDTREFSADFRVTFPMLLDEEDLDFPASNAFGISSVPTMFLVEPDGAISRVMEGWSRKDIESLGAKAGVAVFRKGENVPAWKAG